MEVRKEKCTECNYDLHVSTCITGDYKPQEFHLTFCARCGTMYEFKIDGNELYRSKLTEDQILEALKEFPGIELTIIKSVQSFQFNNKKNQS